MEGTARSVVGLGLRVVPGLLLRTILVRGRLFRGQASLLFLASLPPFAGNAVYVAGLADTDLHLTVFGFSISGLLAGWAILRWKLLSIGPIARDTIEGWTLVLHDVTDRAAEAEALRRARDVAEDTALAQRAFLTNMNHELRTPLSTG